MGGRRGANRVMAKKPEEKRLLGKPRRKWENNIRMDIKQIFSERVAWIFLFIYEDKRRAVLKAVMSVQVL